MAVQKHIDTLRSFASVHQSSWILLRDDMGKKPTLLFKYLPQNWNITEDQVGLGNPKNGDPPYIFWVLNKNAQWEILSE